MRQNVYSSAVCTQILPRHGRPSSTIPGARKLEIGCPMVKTASLCVLTQYRSVTDGQTYRRICRSICSACKALRRAVKMKSMCRPLVQPCYQRLHVGQFSSLLFVSFFSSLTKPFLFLPFISAPVRSCPTSSRPTHTGWELLSFEFFANVALLCLHYWFCHCRDCMLALLTL